MRYKSIVRGRFISRPNRFIAKVDVDGTEETVHVKNTGRCRELLVTDATVYLSVSDNPERKTKYDLVAVEKIRGNGEGFIVNMDSQIPNDVAEEWLKGGELFGADAKVFREKKYGDSRFDFYIEYDDKKAFLEVKGVTLENEGVVMFPDAPTERGVKHINELVSAIDDGYEAYVLFVIQMGGVVRFEPNDNTHKAFGDALRRAREHGVEIIAVECDVTPDSMKITNRVPVLL